MSRKTAWAIDVTRGRTPDASEKVRPWSLPKQSREVLIFQKSIFRRFESIQHGCGLTLRIKQDFFHKNIVSLFDAKPGKSIVRLVMLRESDDANFEIFDKLSKQVFFRFQRRGICAFSFLSMIKGDWQRVTEIFEPGECFDFKVFQVYIILIYRSYKPTSFGPIRGESFWNRI